MEPRHGLAPLCLPADCEPQSAGAERGAMKGKLRLPEVFADKELG